MEQGYFATVTYSGVRINFISHDNFNLGFETVGPSRIKQGNEDSRPFVSRLRFPVANRRGLAARLCPVVLRAQNLQTIKVTLVTSQAPRWHEVDLIWINHREPAAAGVSAAR